MNHFALLILCFLSVEIFIKSNYFALISSILKLNKKAIYTILNKKISDDKKEKILPKYSMLMMKFSLQMLLGFLFIIFIFIAIDNIFSGFLVFAFSWIGVIESILFTFSYAYFRKVISN